MEGLSAWVRDWRRSGPIALIVGIAGLLRAINAGSQSLFLDEAWSWATTQLSSLEMVQLAFADPHPPLYYLLLKLTLAVVADNEFGLRLLSIIFSLANLACILVFVQSRWNTRATLFVGMLLALSSFDLYYAQEARMYTLLGFLWAVSLLSLSLAYAGRQRFWLLWAISASLLPWTHLYGVIVAWTHLLCAGGLLIAANATLDGAAAAHRRKLIGGALIIFLSSLAPLAIALLHSSRGAGGAWVAAWGDLRVLLLLTTIGFPPVRSAFLDGGNLVIPALAAWPPALWMGAAILVGALPAAWGLLHTWRHQPQQRHLILLSLALIGVPVMLIFSYSMLAEQRIWAFKPFLGAAYLWYIWVGVGISAAPKAILRIGCGAALLLIAASSLGPYYTTWNKGSAATAFGSLPTLPPSSALILEPYYLSPLAAYYQTAPLAIYHVALQAEQPAALQQLYTDRANRFGRSEPRSCNDMAAIRELWIYDYNERTRTRMADWPECLRTKQLWAFQNGAWQRLAR